MLEDNREEYFALAPHTMQRREVLIDLHSVVTRAKRGDLIRVMRNTGGGGHCVTGAVLTHDVMYPEDFFLKTSYVSLIYKCRIVFKIFTDPFLSYTLPWRG